MTSTGPEVDLTWTHWTTSTKTIPHHTLGFNLSQASQLCVLSCSCPLSQGNGWQRCLWWWSGVQVPFAFGEWCYPGDRWVFWVEWHLHGQTAAKVTNFATCSPSKSWCWSDDAAHSLFEGTSCCRTTAGGKASRPRPGVPIACLGASACQGCCCSCSSSCYGSCGAQGCSKACYGS